MQTFHKIYYCYVLEQSSTFKGLHNYHLYSFKIILLTNKESLSNISFARINMVNITFLFDFKI